MPNLPKIHPYSYLSKIETHEAITWDLAERIGRYLTYWTNNLSSKKPIRFNRYITQIHTHGKLLESYDNYRLETEINNLRHQLRSAVKPPMILISQTIALIREISGRELNQYHYDTQIQGGLAILFGYITEMHTGEGKTLTAVLPAAFAALMGVPTYVLTVNDYLVERDAESMKPVYQRLGLTLGIVIHGMSDLEKQQAHACDVIYCTANELVFDYLKDQTLLQGKPYQLKTHTEYLINQESLLQKRLIKGLHFAIIDEIDSILLDEARTPLILSGQTTPDSGQEIIYHQALQLAKQLTTKDYELNLSDKYIELTKLGVENLTILTDDQGDFWSNSRRGNSLVKKALYALHILHKDIDYLIKDEKIIIIDENTGRLMPDRSWERGLHQLVELKEQCPITQSNETLTQLTYPIFFQYFDNLAGMSGTVKEAKQELWLAYQLKILFIPLNKLSLRKNLGIKRFKHTKDKNKYIIQKAITLSKQGRSILIGSSSVKVSEQLHQYFDKMDIQHQILNARQDAKEAQIVSQAGQAGMITIATNMAGRGTDIKLSESSKKAGGLHVISSEFHLSRRLDRQLVGRSARQGDPGSYEILIGPDDALLSSQNLWDKRLLSLSSNQLWLFYQIKRLQSRLDKKDRKLRYELLKSNVYQNMLLSLGRKGF